MNSKLNISTHSLSSKKSHKSFTDNSVCLVHDGQMITNFCSANQCRKPLCPQCIEEHFSQHKSAKTHPQIESLKNTRQKCMYKVRDVIRNFSQIIEKSNFPEPPETALQRHMFKLDQIKRKVFDLMDVKFTKVQELIKKRVNSNAFIFKQYEDLQVKCQAIMNQLNSLSSGLQKQPSLKLIDKVLSLNADQLYKRIGKSINQINQSSKHQQLDINFQPSALYEFIQSIDQLLLVAKAKRRQEPVSKDIRTVKPFERLQEPQEVREVNIYNFNTFDSKQRYLHFFQSGENTIQFLNLDKLVKGFCDFEKIKIANFRQIPQFHKSISVPNGDLYLIGGSMGQTKSNKIYKFNFGTKNLDEVGTMNLARSSHCLCFLDRYIYIIGGLGSRGSTISSCQRFDILTNKVEQIAQMKYPSIYSCSAAFNGRYIFKFGGVGAQSNIILNIQRYDYKVNEWMQIDPDIQKSIQSHFKELTTSAAIQITKNQIFVFGGYDNLYAGHRQSYFLQCDIINNNYQIKRLNQFPLPLNEAFWNNVPILLDRKIYCLQNVASASKSQCIQNIRRVLSFDGRAWKIHNDI